MTRELNLDPQKIQGVDSSTSIGKYSFPARKDYENYFIQRGYISTAEELWLNDSLISQVQRHWHTRGQNGCVFAQVIAFNSENLGWTSFVYRGQEIGKIDLVINKAISDEQNNAVSLLFPNVTNQEQLVDLLHNLAKTESIKISKEETIDELVLLALRTPLKGNEVLSWLIGFGPFSFLPETRQSPVTEIIVRTKLKPERQFYRLNQEKGFAHVADIPVQMSDSLMETIWQATYNRTREVLGGNDKRVSNKFASAKVTIAVPSRLWFKE